jgi:hypothetical protein
MSDKNFDKIYKQYQEKYDLDDLSNPNDIANLTSMIKNQLLIDKIREKLDDSINEGDLNPAMLAKNLENIGRLSDANLQLEKALGLDRKTRKQQQQTSIVDITLRLKQMAKEFLDDDRRLTKVMCKKCKIMVGRISGVYNTTEYSAAFQCPQCKKNITIHRKERDVFYDVKDADWRRKYPIEIVQPANYTKDAPIIEEEDDLIIGDGVDYLEGD